MLSEDYQVLQKLTQWMASDVDAWLCTVVKTLGSAPRPIGSLLACNSRGEQVGSLSGGCVEEDLLASIRAGQLDQGLPRLLEYGVTAEENERLGLPCGGRLQVLVEKPGELPASQVLFQKVLEGIAARQCRVRHLDLSTGESRLEVVESFQPLTFSASTLSQCYGPRMRMLLVGAGQLAQSLAELALAMDYEVMVNDPRPELLAQWGGPVVTLLPGMPDDAVRQHASDKHCIIITLTHDPRVDDMALMEALLTDAWYIGALGSVRTTEKRKQRLRQLDLPDAAIARLHAPVGLSIGSKTPIEIAISIMAEITCLRRGAA